MKILILTTNHRSQVINMLDDIDTDEHEVFVPLVGKCDWDELPDYDIGISYMYLHKVPSEQLSKPWFNFHPAPLPEYKGRNLCYHAIVNGEKRFGATLHYMDENFDTGDIIKVRDFEIEGWMNAEDVSRSAVSASQSLFVEYLPRILAGEEFTRSKNIGGTYYKKEAIADTVDVDKSNFIPSFWLNRFIRAVTYKEFYPKIEIGGVKYKIVRDE